MFVLLCKLHVVGLLTVPRCACLSTTLPYAYCIIERHPYHWQRHILYKGRQSEVPCKLKEYLSALRMRHSHMCAVRCETLAFRAQLLDHQSADQMLKYKEPGALAWTLKATSSLA